jgi:hypothetical protein
MILPHGVIVCEVIYGNEVWGRGRIFSVVLENGTEK